MRSLVFTLAVLFVLGCGGANSSAPPPPSHSEVMERFRADRSWASSTLRGMTEREARDASRRRGLAFRVVRREGRSLFRTDDRVLTRVNADVRGGVVTRVALY